MNMQTIDKKYIGDILFIIVGIILIYSLPFFTLFQMLGKDIRVDNVIYLMIVSYYIIISTWFYILHKYGIERIEKTLHLS